MTIVIYVCGCFRFIGAAKILLRDLASGQTKSLPSKNVPLMNEKQNAVGVNITLKCPLYHVESVVKRTCNFPGNHKLADWV